MPYIVFVTKREKKSIFRIVIMIKICIELTDRLLHFIQGAEKNRF